MAKVRKFEVTTEEKARWAPMLRRVWDYVAYDALELMNGKCRRSYVVEMACDASRPVEIGGMTAAEYKVLGAWYGTASFKRWVKEVFPSEHYCI